MRNRAMLLSCLLLSGCGANSLVSKEDSAVHSSLQYDKVACGSLLAERDALVKRYHLPVDAKPVFTDVPTGLGAVLPDIRSARQREAQDAAGRVDAMNRSMARRQCAGAPRSA